MGKLDVGETLSKTFTIYFRSLPKLLAIALPIYSPYIALHIMDPGPIDPFTGLRQGNWPAIILSIFLGPFLTASVTFEVLQRMRGRSATIGECLGVGARRLIPVFFVSLLMTFATALGIILLIVPGIIFWVWLSVSVPVCVVERPGVFRSLERSTDLTRGSRWGIFALLLIFAMLYMPVGMVVGIAAVVGRDLPWIADAVLWFSTAATIVLMTFSSVLSASIYHQLRTKKEGALSEELVEVFA